MKNKIKAYKVFDYNWSCWDFKYKVGKTYKLTDENDNLIEPIICERGFHACKKPSNCFTFKAFDSKNKVAEVELSGTILGIDDYKQCANIITIVKEISWHELLDLVNSGNNNNGTGNSGDNNSGNNNSGHYNSGDYNSTDYSNGRFNSKESKFFDVFNKPCEREVWNNAKKPKFFDHFDLNKFIPFDDMTEEEKENNPDAENMGGYLKKYTYKEAWNKAFEMREDDDIEILKELPNFDSEVFEEITGIKID